MGGAGFVFTGENDADIMHNSALINLHVEACMAAFGSIGRGDAAQSVANAVCDALEERVAVKTAKT